MLAKSPDTGQTRITTLLRKVNATPSCEDAGVLVSLSYVGAKTKWGAAAGTVALVAIEESFVLATPCNVDGEEEGIIGELVGVVVTGDDVAAATLTGPREGAEVVSFRGLVVSEVDSDAASSPHTCPAVA